MHACLAQLVDLLLLALKLAAQPDDVSHLALAAGLALVCLQGCQRVHEGASFPLHTLQLQLL